MKHRRTHIPGDRGVEARSDALARVVDQSIMGRMDLGVFDWVVFSKLSYTENKDDCWH